MKKFILTFLVILFAVPIMAQDYNAYLQSAQNKFDLGDYENAQKALKIYVEMTGQSETNLSERITTAIKLLKNAQISTDDQKYAHAITLYKQVLSINPKDPNVQNKINKLQAIINNSHKANQANAIESKLLQIGDKVDGYSVCYLDETKTSGWVIRIDNKKGMQHHHNSYGEWRVPSVEECKVIYKSRFKLGLNKAYWTSTLSKKVANWHFYYTFDFNSGKEKCVFICVYSPPVIQ